MTLSEESLGHSGLNWKDLEQCPSNFKVCKDHLRVLLSPDAGSVALEWGCKSAVSMSSQAMLLMDDTFGNEARASQLRSPLGSSREQQNLLRGDTATRPSRVGIPEEQTSLC